MPSRFDLPGVRIGVAEYSEGPTGCTVFAFERAFASSADVRRGSPGACWRTSWGLTARPVLRGRLAAWAGGGGGGGFGDVC